MATATKKVTALKNKDKVDFATAAAAMYEQYKDNPNVELVDSGSEVINAVLHKSGQGIPRGYLIDFSSGPGLGKSTSMIHVCAKYCELGHTVFYLDVESGVNPSQLKGIGLEPYRYDPITNPQGTFYLISPQTFRELDDAFTMFHKMDVPPALVVVDSITQVVPSKLVDENVEDANIGIHARYTGDLLRKHKAQFRKNKTTLIMINQVRNKFNFKGPTTVEAAGGFSYQHACDIRVKMTQFKQLKKKIAGVNGGDDEVPYGAIVKVLTIKNRHNPPFRYLLMSIIFGRGISNMYSYATLLTDKGLIKSRSSWFDIYLDGDSNPPISVNGQNALEKALLQNKDKVKELVRSLGGFSLYSDEEMEELSRLEESYAKNGASNNILTPDEVTESDETIS